MHSDVCNGVQNILLPIGKEYKNLLFLDSRWRFTMDLFIQNGDSNVYHMNYI